VKLNRLVLVAGLCADPCEEHSVAVFAAMLAANRDTKGVELVALMLASMDTSLCAPRYRAPLLVEGALESPLGKYLRKQLKRMPPLTKAASQLSPSSDSADVDVAAVDSDLEGAHPDALMLA
jgi:hypothetical protein